MQTSNIHVLKGHEASTHVRDLLNRPIGRHLRIAFDQLAAVKGVKVDITKAWGVTGHGRLKTAFESPERLQPHLGSASLSLIQSFSMSDSNVDLEWFPADSEENYWSGTFYAAHSDDTGNVDVEEIVNIEQQYILNNAQGWGDTYQYVSYGRDERGPYEARLGSNFGLVVASFNRQTSYGLRLAGLHWKGNYSDWLGCGTSWCVGAGGGCALANFWDAEVAWAPCTGAGCIGGYVGCTWGTLWGTY